LWLPLLNHQCVLYKLVRASEWMSHLEIDPVITELLYVYMFYFKLEFKFESTELLHSAVSGDPHVRYCLKF